MADQDEDEFVRFRAMLGMHDLVTDAPSELTDVVLNEDEAVSLRVHAVNSLNEIGGRRATEALRQASDSHKRRVRKAAARAMSRPTPRA